MDNDPLLCDFTTPTLTSVYPDHALEGQMAAEAIDRMIRKRSGSKVRRILNETLANAITERRLKEVARRLRQTNLSIHAISASCGFQNPNHLKNLFKRRYGMSMREWRAIRD